MAIQGMVQSLDYVSIIVLMTIESSFIPFPSEVVIPPAAYLAQQGKLDFWLVVAAGTLGSLFGALINYFLADWLGRPLIYKLAETRLARILHLDREKLEKAEDYFLKYGKMSTFIGRLVPGIRQLISIPAGLSKMKLTDFILFTVLGAGLWNLILAVAGYTIGANKEMLSGYYHELSLAGVILFVFFIIYLYLRRKKKRRTE